MVETLRVRRWEKRNRFNFYWGVVKVCVGSIQYGGIETFCAWTFLSEFLVKIF